MTSAVLLIAAIHLEPCQVAGVRETLRCGTLEVAENRRALGGHRIALRVVVVPAAEPRPDAAPLFHLEGGPGVAASDMAALYATEVPEYRRHRDVVLVDQRGTGGSNPLRCAWDETRARLERMYPPEAVAECRRQLEARADLTQYTTEAAADDSDDVRAALGYDRIDLFGLSYGTRHALVYMRRHPEHVRSAVLMGPAPTDLSMPLHHAQDGQRALDMLFEDCASDASCGRAFPRLRPELAGVLDRLAAEPAPLTLNDPRTGAAQTYHLTRGAFAEEIRRRLYAPATRITVPLVIHQAAQGDYGPLVEAVARGNGGPTIAEGLYLSVTCAEDVPFIDPTMAERLAAGTVFGLYRVQEQRGACQEWPRASVAEEFRRPVESKAPTLILSGDRDPITPPRLGDEVLRHLPNGRHRVIPQAAHAPMGIEPMSCLDGVMLSFYENPLAPDLQDGCLKEMRAPPFVLRSPGSP